MFVFECLWPEVVVGIILEFSGVEESEEVLIY